MALYAAARRAAASSAPILRAAASGAPHGIALLRPLAAATARPQPRAMPFSSVPVTRPASDAELLSIIDSEIKYAKESDDHDRVEQIPDNFPFKIIDEKGLNIITLKRTYQREQIEVMVRMSNLVTGEEPDEYSGGEGGDSPQEDEGERPPQSSIPLTVTVSKGAADHTLEFSCTAYPDEVIIDSLAVTQKPADDETELIAYEGPEFNDLDENLQKAFHKYLELRGISPMTTNFLHEYMINKDSREYLLWLMKLKQFFTL